MNNYFRKMREIRKNEFLKVANLEKTKEKSSFTQIMQFAANAASQDTMLPIPGKFLSRRANGADSFIDDFFTKSSLLKTNLKLYLGKPPGATFLPERDNKPYAYVREECHSNATKNIIGLPEKQEISYADRFMFRLYVPVQKINSFDVDYERYIKHQVARVSAAYFDKLLLKGEIPRYSDSILSSNPASLSSDQLMGVGGDWDALLRLFDKQGISPDFHHNNIWLISPDLHQKILRRFYFTDEKLQKYYSKDKLYNLPIVTCPREHGLGSEFAVLGDFSCESICIPEDYLKIRHSKSESSNDIYAYNFYFCFSKICCEEKSYCLIKTNSNEQQAE